MNDLHTLIMQRDYIATQITRLQCSIAALNDIHFRTPTNCSSPIVLKHAAETSAKSPSPNPSLPSSASSSISIYSNPSDLSEQDQEQDTPSTTTTTKTSISAASQSSSQAPFRPPNAGGNAHKKPRPKKRANLRRLKLLTTELYALVPLHNNLSSQMAHLEQAAWFQMAGRAVCEGYGTGQQRFASWTTFPTSESEEVGVVSTLDDVVGNSPVQAYPVSKVPLEYLGYGIVYPR